MNPILGPFWALLTQIQAKMNFPGKKGCLSIFRYSPFCENYAKFYVVNFQNMPCRQTDRQTMVILQDPPQNGSPKIGEEIPESSRLAFSERFLSNNSALSGAEDNTFGPLNRVGIPDLPLLRTLLAIRQKSREPCFWEVIDSDGKFDSFKNPLSELQIILQVQTKIVISMNYGNSTSC